MTGATRQSEKRIIVADKVFAEIKIKHVTMKMLKAILIARDNASHSE